MNMQLKDKVAIVTGGNERNWEGHFSPLCRGGAEVVANFSKDVDAAERSDERGSNPED